MTAITTQGSIIQIQNQSAFGTPATTGFQDVKNEGNPTIKTPVGEALEVNSLFADPNEKEKPVILKKAMDDAVTITSLIRQAKTAGTDSTLAMLFGAGGYDVQETSDGTVTAYTDEGAFTISDATVQAGDVICVELDDGSFCNVLVASASSGAVTPAMDLPSATSIGKAVKKTFTMSPDDTGQIADANLLTVRAYLKSQTSGLDSKIVYQDMAVTSFADLDLKAGEVVAVEATLGASTGVISSSGSSSLPANTFRDASRTLPFNCPLVQFATASASGGITASYQKLLSVKFTWGITAEQIAGFGSTDCVNNIQGWISKVDAPKITLEMLYDSDKITDFDYDENASKYIGIVQRGYSDSDPAFSLFVPNAYQIDPPEADYYGNNEHRITVTYTGNPAGFNSSYAEGDIANKTFYFSIADNES